MAKAKSKLDTLAAQLPPPPPPEGEGAPQEQQTPPPVMQVGPSEEFKVLCRMPVMAFGAAITKHYKCPMLDANEVTQIAGALAGVLHAHGIKIDDPRIAAWLTLGGAIAMAAQPRLEYIAATNAKPANEPAPEAEQKPDAVAA